MSASAPKGSFLTESFRIGAGEVRRNLYGVRGSMWAVLVAVALNLATSHLLLTDRELSPAEQSEVLYVVASLSVGLGLLVAGVFAADPVPEKERTTPEEALIAPTGRGAPLLGKFWGVMATWLLVFTISTPYILVVGFGTRFPWEGLVYTFLVGTLCVAGFATLIMGIRAHSRSGRGVTLASVGVLVAMAVPTLPGIALHGGRLGDVYRASSPVAQASLSLEGVFVDKEAPLAQLPHVGALAAFAVLAAVVVVLAVRGVSPARDAWPGGSRDIKLWDALRPRSRADEPARAPRSPKQG